MKPNKKLSYYLSYISVVSTLSLLCFSFFTGSLIFLLSLLIQINNWYEWIDKSPAWVTMGISIISVFTLANICLFVSENIVIKFLHEKLQGAKNLTAILLALTMLFVYISFIYFGFNIYIYYISRWFWSMY
jgi:hypothetical protein